MELNGLNNEHMCIKVGVSTSHSLFSVFLHGANREIISKFSMQRSEISALFSNIFMFLIADRDVTFFAKAHVFQTLLIFYSVFYSSPEYFSASNRDDRDISSRVEII